MSEPLAHTTSQPSMFSAADFPARTFRRRGRGSVSMGRGLDYGGSTPDSLASFDPATSSWRTRQICFSGEWAEFAETWPRSGMTRNGTLYQRAPLVPHIHGSACSWWPTPRASDRDNCGGSGARRNALRNGTYVGRRMNPQLTEWLMGYPIDHTALPHSETASSRTLPNGLGGASSKRKKGEQHDGTR
jgi:hypothetical protein